jgi:hypothetical protein
MRRLLMTFLILISLGFGSFTPTVQAEGNSRKELVQRLKERDSWGRQAKAVRHSIIVCKWIVDHRFGWTNEQWEALKTLWSRESGWRYWAPGGIPQFRPTNKLKDDNNPVSQCRQGGFYIVGRYGTAKIAYAHFRSVNWY